METREIVAFYKEWCKLTNRNGGVLIGNSIQELLVAFANQFLEGNNTQ